jgi:hypothetical protein
MPGLYVADCFLAIRFCCHDLYQTPEVQPIPAQARPGDTKRIGPEQGDCYLMLSSSMSKLRVELGGMGPLACEP